MPVLGTTLFCFHSKHLPRRIGARLRVAAHIPIGVHPQDVALHHVRREEDTRHRVVVARHVVIQPADAIALLAREADAGGQCARVVALVAVRPEQLLAHDAPTGIEHQHLAAQRVIPKVVERAVHRGGDAHPSHGVVGGGGGGAARGLHLFEVADVGGECAGAAHRGLHGHAVACAIVEVVGDLRGCAGLVLPTGEPSFGIVAQLLARWGAAGRWSSGK